MERGGGCVERGKKGNLLFRRGSKPRRDYTLSHTLRSSSELSFGVSTQAFSALSSLAASPLRGPFKGETKTRMANHPTSYSRDYRRSSICVSSPPSPLDAAVFNTDPWTVRRYARLELIISSLYRVCMYICVYLSVFKIEIITGRSIFPRKSITAPFIFNYVIERKGETRLQNGYLVYMVVTEFRDGRA